MLMAVHGGVRQPLVIFRSLGSDGQSVELNESCPTTYPSINYDEQKLSVMTYASSANYYLKKEFVVAPRICLGIDCGSA